MGIQVPKESYVVGHERKDGTLDFYAMRNDIERYPEYKGALAIANRLNKDEERGRAPWATTEWRVYRMNFEEVKSTEPVPLKTQ